MVEDCEVNISVVPEPTLAEIAPPNYEISKFKLTRILINNTKSKVVTVLGIFPDVSETDQAIILLEKTAFTEKNVSAGCDEEIESYFSSKTKLKTEFINNIYGSFHCFPESEINAIKTTVIYPATEKHIEKYSTHEKYLCQETPELYEKITKPYIESEQFSLDWVYNILEHKQETERIIYEDPDPENGFILLPDMKWDGRTIETLYALAIVHKRNIKSLRDLDGSHLQLLKNIRDAGCEAIYQKYGVLPSQIRTYFHYQPSFYHLHVHFNPLKNEAPGIYCEKSHLLDTVINNLELMSDYYKKVTLPFPAYDGNKLLEKFEEIVIKPFIRTKKDSIDNDDTRDVSSNKKMKKDDDSIENNLKNDEKVKDTSDGGGSDSNINDVESVKKEEKDGDE